MEYFAFIFFVFIAFLSWMWGRHIEYMEKNHPGYNGKDFLSQNPNKDDDRPSDEDN